MGKKRSIAAKGTLPPALGRGLRGIEKPETVLNVCLPVLRKQFGQTTLGFEPTNRSAKVTRFTLSGTGQQRGTAREAYPILPLCRSTNAIYWAGITVNFQFLGSSHQLVDAGIIIFEGDAFAERKIPVLRAEWHCSDEQMQEIHAQPHWHAYHPPPQYLGPRFNAGSPTAFAPDEQTEERADREAQLMSFHFAMSAEWQRGEMKAHVGAIASAKALGDWLSGCLSYIVGQLS
jgi:hypothetical protein